MKGTEQNCTCQSAPNSSLAAASVASPWAFGGEQVELLEIVERDVSVPWVRDAMTLHRVVASQICNEQTICGITSVAVEATELRVLIVLWRDKNLSIPHLADFPTRQPVGNH
jgi:hypothetical protein